MNASPRLPARARIAYAAASLSGNALSQAWGLWLIYFYAPPADSGLPQLIPGVAGLDPRVTLGVLLTAARLLEALDDPLIGYWSDRTRSRWGRRLPFAVLGTPWWALFFVLLFTPPGGEGAAVNLVYLFIVAEVHYLLSNLAGAPLEALLPHLARRQDDRVSVATWQVVFGVTGAAIGLSLSSLVQATLGFRAMAVTVGVVALLARAVAIGGTWRYAKTDATPSSTGFRLAMRQTFTNPQFLAFLPSFVLFQVGLQMLTALLPFFVIAVLHDSTLFGRVAQENEGLFAFLLTAAVIAGMLVAVPLFRRLATARGKAAAYRVAMLGAAAYFPLLFFAGFVPVFPRVAQAAVAIFVAGLPTAGVYLFPNIITADIVDDDAERTGSRREAMFYGAQNLLEKLATALSPLLFALLLLAGDSADDPTGVRLVGPAAGLLVLGGYATFRRYSLAPEFAEGPLDAARRTSRPGRDDPR